MVFRIRHATTYRYAEPVRFGPHRLMLRPRDSFDLRVVGTGLSVSPHARIDWMHDVYGNPVATASIETASDTLDIVSELVVERFGSAAPRAPLVDVQDRGLQGACIYGAAERMVLQPYIDIAAADPAGVLPAWIADFRKERRSGHLLRDLAHAVYADLDYAVRFDEGTQHPADTLLSRRGSCRDYAWLFIELARRLGFAARFVSGYIHDSSAALVSAVGLTHAWAEVFIPGDGWVEFDPTNDLVADRQLLRVAVARLPEHASPVSGSFIGSAGAFLGLSVGVTIEEVDGLDDTRQAA